MRSPRRFLLRPALREYAPRVRRICLAYGVDGAVGGVPGRCAPGRALSELQRLAAAIPTGLFDNRAIERAMRELLATGPQQRFSRAAAGCS